MDKISVIMPFYNSEKTIRRCIESVLEQTYVNFDLICISDGSTDSSEKIVSDYSVVDGRVKLIRVLHGGVSRARNAGLDIADGDYIQFIDADDYIEPDMMQKMLWAIKENNACVSICAFTHPSLQNYSGDRIYNMKNEEDVIALYQNAFAVVVPWNKLFKREIVTARFIEDIAFCEDELFCDEVLLNAKSVASISDKLYHYYVAPKGTDKASAINSISESEFWKNDKSVFQMRKKLCPVAKKIFEGRVSEKCAELLESYRIFDFMLWGMSIYIASQADESGTAAEILRTLTDPAFQKSIEVKKQFGIKMKNKTECEYKTCSRRLVSFCFDYFRQNGNSEKNYRPYEIYLTAFAKMFVTREKDRLLDTSDSLASALYSLETGSTPEAVYVNNSFEETMTA